MREDLTGVTTPILRAGLGNVHVFVMAIALWMAGMSVADGRASALVAFPLAALVVAFVAHRYARVVCAYELSPAGLAITTPITTVRFALGDLTELKMHLRPLAGGGIIRVRRRHARRHRDFLLVGVDLDFGTLLWHFNDAAAAALADAAGSTRTLAGGEDTRHFCGPRQPDSD